MFAHGFNVIVYDSAGKHKNTELHAKSTVISLWLQMVNSLHKQEVLLTSEFPVSVCLNKSLGNKHKDISNWAVLKRCQEKALSNPILNIFHTIQELFEES